MRSVTNICPREVVHRHVQTDPRHELRRAEAGGVHDRIGEHFARRAIVDADDAVAALGSGTDTRTPVLNIGAESPRRLGESPHDRTAA